MDIGIKTWKRNDWTCFVLIFLVLTYELLFVGYPIIFPDSERYLGAAVFLRRSPYSPTLVCYLIRPLVVLLGAWGFAFFQIAILTYALVSTLRFFNKNAAIGIISIITSAAGFVAIAVMMDIYTAIGLLALFLVLNGSRDIILYIILSLCFIAHYGNIFLFPVCAILYWVIFKRKNPATLALLAILFILPLVMAFLVNYRMEKNFRFLTTAKYSFIAARIMEDTPEVTRAYMEKYPASDLAKHRQEYEDIMSGRRKIVSIMWDKNGLFDKFGGNIKFNSEAKEFVLYALKNHPGTLLRNIIYGIYRFLARPNYNSALIRRCGPLVRQVETYLPQQTEQIKKSLQYIDKLGVINFQPFYLLCYYISLLLSSGFLILCLWFPKMRKTRYFSFVVFVLFAIFFNALIFSIGLSGGRFQVRALLLPCLAACLIVSDIFRYLIFPLNKKGEDT